MTQFVYATLSPSLVADTVTYLNGDFAFVIQITVR